MNTEDADVGRFLRLFTFFPEDEIKRLTALEGAELRSAKEILATEVTRIVHGEAAAEEAKQAARALFGGAAARWRPFRPPPSRLSGSRTASTWRTCWCWAPWLPRRARRAS